MMTNQKHFVSMQLNNINRFQPSCSVLLGDYNAKHSKWCSTDNNNEASVALENITSTAGYKQMINIPTYFECTSLIIAVK